MFVDHRAAMSHAVGREAMREDRRLDVTEPRMIEGF
jgi:hypothetical protein